MLVALVLRVKQVVTASLANHNRAPVPLLNQRPFMIGKKLEAIRTLDTDFKICFGVSVTIHSQDLVALIQTNLQLRLNRNHCRQRQT